MTLKALIFDVDGTLSNTETKGHLAAFNQAFSQIGLDWFWSNELYNDLLRITGGKQRIKYYINQYIPNFDYRQYLNNVTNKMSLDDWISSVHQLKTQIFIDIFHTDKMPLRTGIQALFDEALDMGIILAIATTTSLANVVALISHTLGQQYLQNFAVIAAGDNAKCKKPDGEIYTYALDKLGLNANECLVFEDSENGILAATQAGIKSIITVNEYSIHHQFDGALLVLDHLGDKQQPFKVLGGRAIQCVADKTWVDVNLLKTIYAKYC